MNRFLSSPVAEAHRPLRAGLPTGSSRSRDSDRFGVRAWALALLWLLVARGVALGAPAATGHARGPFPPLRTAAAPTNPAALPTPAAPAKDGPTAVAPAAADAAVAPPVPPATSLPAAPPAAPLATAETLTPLPPAWAQALRSIVEDPAPPALVRDQHYIISNESRHDLFRPAALGRGGVYIGVGSDQNYLLAGWARPELVFLFDFDQLVVNLHRVYRVFFLSAATPAEFMALWEVRNEKQAESLLTAEYTEPAQRAAVLRAYRTARYAVPRRFRTVLLAYKPSGVASFLDDLEQYRYLAALFRTGRVVMVRGDLTAGTCMSSIAAAVQAIGRPVRLLYLSNAERYFTYNDAFRKSMLALPTDESSLVLRTRARRDGSYEYIEQEADNFRAWVSRRSIQLSFQYTHLREPAAPPVKDHAQDESLYAIRRLPPPLAAAKPPLPASTPPPPASAKPPLPAPTPPPKPPAAP